MPNVLDLEAEYDRVLTGFRGEMKARLMANKSKGLMWRDDEDLVLVYLALKESLELLLECISHEVKAERIREEAADAANFCMMIWDKNAD